MASQPALAGRFHLVQENQAALRKIQPLFQLQFLLHLEAS